MLTIKVLGSGCANCKRLEEIARKAATDMGVEAEFIKVTDHKDILAHELKMNDAYAFFAASMIDKGGDGAGKLVSDGLAYRERAIKAIETGGEKEAIDALKASTELLIKALQSAGD